MTTVPIPGKAGSYVVTEFRDWLRGEIGECTSAAYAASIAQSIEIDWCGDEYDWIVFTIDNTRWHWNPDDGWDDHDVYEALIIKLWNAS